MGEYDVNVDVILDVREISVILYYISRRTYGQIHNIFHVTSSRKIGPS
jgi:hypothetical protein